MGVGLKFCTCALRAYSSTPLPKILASPLQKYHCELAGVRIDAINENMTKYFDLLEVYNELDFKEHPERIYNMDETGMPLDPRPPKVQLTEKGAQVRNPRSQSLSVEMQLARRFHHILSSLPSN